MSLPAKLRNPYLRYGAVLAAVALLFVGAAYLLTSRDDLPPPRQVRELTIVNIVPPPPPPPPPPQKPPEEKMIEQPKMAEPEFKEDKPKDEPVKDAKTDEPPASPLPPGAKLDEAPGNTGWRQGGGGGGGGGSRWGWYTSIVTAQVESALRSNPKTRKMAARIEIRLWADSTGRVNRVVITPSTGDVETDAIIRNEVLGSLTLREPPPKDMPMPMVTRVTASRPSGGGA